MDKLKEIVEYFSTQGYIIEGVRAFETKIFSLSNFTDLSSIEKRESIEKKIIEICGPGKVIFELDRKNSILDVYYRNNLQEYNFK